MSKGLEALKRILNKRCGYCPFNHEDMSGDECEECDRYDDIVEKSLKAFEFIKPYINVYVPNRSVDRDKYMLCVGHDAYEIPKEIYNLLKEVLL